MFIAKRSLIVIAFAINLATLGHSQSHFDPAIRAGQEAYQRGRISEAYSSITPASKSNSKFLVLIGSIAVGAVISALRKQS